MEQNVTEDNVLGSGAIGEIQLGEIANEDVLVVYLSQGDKDRHLLDGVERLHDISECKKYKAEHCICSSKIHYGIEGSVLCVRDMKPFIYIGKMSIACRKNKKTRKSVDT